MTGKDYKTLKSKSDVSSILKSITDRIEDIEMIKVDSESSISGTISITDEVPTSYIEQIHVSPDDPFISDEDIDCKWIRRAGRYINGYVEMSATEVGALFVEVTDGQITTDLSAGDMIFLISDDDNQISAPIEVSSFSGANWQYIVFDSSATIYKGTNRIIKMYDYAGVFPIEMGVYSYIEYPKVEADLISIGASARFLLNKTLYSETAVMKANKFYGLTSEDAYSEEIGISGSLSIDKYYNSSIIRMELVPDATDGFVYNYRNGSYLPQELDEARYSLYDQSVISPKKLNVPALTNTFTTATIEALLGGTIAVGSTLMFIPEEMIEDIDYGNFTYATNEYTETSGWTIVVVANVYASTFDTAYVDAGKYYISYVPYDMDISTPSTFDSSYSFSKVVMKTDEYWNDVSNNVVGVLLSSPMVMEMKSTGSGVINYVQEVVV